MSGTFIRTTPVFGGLMAVTPAAVLAGPLAEGEHEHTSDIMRNDKMTDEATSAACQPSRDEAMTLC
jgi:hypothetical protein